MNVPKESDLDPLYHETTRKLKWLVWARWIGVAGQIATAVMAHQFLKIDFNVLGLAACMGFVVCSNAWIHLNMDRLGSVTRWVVTFVLVFDSLILTAMLHWSGGAHNPFTSFYLLHVTLAAVLLPGLYALGISILSVVGFVWLYVTAQSCCGDSLGLLSAGISQDLHFQGMVVSLALTAIFISVFVGKIQSELSRSHRMLGEAQVDLEKQERFQSLATLAAGVAHELATPLGTIALVSKEIEGETLDGDKPMEELVEDLKLIRREVDRCRTIIDRLNIENLSLDARPGVVSVRSIVEDFETIVPSSIRERLQIAVMEGIENERIRVSRMQLFSSLHAILKNACEADETTQPIDMRIEKAGAMLRLQISDHGPGVSSDDIGKLGEPFYTTKGPQEGMGLGLFLARMFAEKSSGHLRFYSSGEPDLGLTVQLDLPLMDSDGPELVG